MAFNKLKGRLKNNNIPIDIVYHTKNTPVDEMTKLLYDAENRAVKDKDGRTKLNRIRIDENEHYVAWEVLDWQTAMNMGDNTSWCISGRYGTNGEVKLSQAKEFFKKYKDDGVEHYVYLIPKHNEEKYCVCLERDKDRFKFWDAVDTDYGMGVLPIDENLIGLKLYDLIITKDDLIEFTIRNNTLIKYSGRSAIVNIPNTVQSIGDFAFNNYDFIESVTIPNSVIKIGGNAFQGCEALTSVIMPNSVTCIKDNAFNGCLKLSSITLSNSLISIKENAFRHCVSLPSVIIPDSVTNLGTGVFDGCPNLTVVTNNEYAQNYCRDNNIKWVKR